MDDNLEDPLGDYDPGSPSGSVHDEDAFPADWTPTEPDWSPADPGDGTESAELFGPIDESSLPPDPGFDDAGYDDPGFDEQPAPTASVRADAVAAWLAVAAAALQNGTPANRARELIGQLRGADPLYRVLEPEQMRQMKSALRTADAILSDVADDGEVWLDQMGVFSHRGGRAHAEQKELFVKIANTPPAHSPESRLGGALFSCRKALSRDSAQRLVHAIDDGADPEELGKIFNEILPPSAIEGTQLTENPSLRDMVTAVSNVPLSTFSSGFRTLDVAMHTNRDQPLGFIRSGQLAVMVAASGCGKTSTIMSVVVAMTTDMLRQGSRGRGLFVHNEDETAELFAAVDIRPGGRHENLLDHLVAKKTTSRTEFVKMFYLEVLRAKHQSAETGLPVKAFMPPWVIVDYYQALTDGETSEVEATNKTADLLLYGIANCDPVALAAFSGLSFQTFTGEAWPDHLDGHNVAVLVTAQLLLKGNQKPFDPDKDNWRSYATATPSDEPAWPVEPGDYPLAKLDDIRGSTKIVQHATTIVGLHRSRPRNNPVDKSKVDPRGFEHLADTRGYFTILKARYGQKMLVVEMEFDRQRNGGPKAQYIDARAETAMERMGGRFVYDDELFNQSGDCIIPRRPVPTKMRMVSYRGVAKAAAPAVAASA